MAERQGFCLIRAILFKIKYLASRPGERYASALIGKNSSNKVYKLFGKIQLKDYLSKIINKINQ